MEPDAAHQTSALLARTAKAAGWVIVWRLATRLLGMASTLTLVRLLAPADFGVVALGASFAQGIEALGTFGVEEAVIRERAPTRQFYDTAFTLNVLRNLVIALAVAGFAFPAGRFFGEPQITPILLALAVAYLLDGFANIGVVEFRRNLAFDKEFLLLIVPRVAGIIVTIASAIAWRNYVALVLGIITTRILKVGFGYRMHPYRPRLSLHAWRQLIGYSVWTWALTVLEMVRDRSDSIMIGRFLNPTKVGLYAIGFEVSALSSTELVEPLSRAAFSGFAAARHSGISVGETYLRIISTAFLVTMPAGIGIALVAEPLVSLAFGPQWIEAVPLIRVLASAFSISVFSVLGYHLLSAQSLLSHTFKIMLAGATTRVVLLAILIPAYGLIGAAYAAAASTLLEQVLYIGVTFRVLGLRVSQLAAHLWRTVVATGCMVGMLAATGLAMTDAVNNPAARLAAAAMLGAVTYAVALMLCWWASGRREGAEADLLTLLRRAFGRGVRTAN
jgi:lipopolysaccharide exporter